MRMRTWTLVATAGAVALAPGVAPARAPRAKKVHRVATADYRGPLFHLFVKKHRLEIVDTTNAQGIRGTCRQSTGATTPFRDQPSLTPDWLIPGSPPIIGRHAKYAKTTRTASGGQVTTRTLNLTVHFTTAKKGTVALADHVVVATPGGKTDCRGTASETVRFLRAG